MATSSLTVSSATSNRQRMRSRVSSPAASRPVSRARKASSGALRSLDISISLCLFLTRVKSEGGDYTRPLRLWMESVWLRLVSGPATSVQSIRLGFLGPWPFVAKTTPMSVGWISLDFLVRIYTFNGLRALKRRTFHSRFSRGVRSATTGACGRGNAEGQHFSWSELNLASVFLQMVVVRAVPFRPVSIQKQLASRRDGSAARRRQTLRRPPFRARSNPRDGQGSKGQRHASGKGSGRHRSWRRAPESSAGRRPAHSGD